MKKKIIGFLYDILIFIIGCFMYSVAVTVFLSSNEMTPGGITGVATAVNYVFSLPTGTVLFLLNVPILILGFVKFGGFFIIKTAIATVLLSICLEISENFLPVFVGDKILAAVFGGILAGGGLSLIIRRGATTGGVDILAKLLNRIFRHFSVGKLIFLMDTAVIALAILVYGNFESGLYSAVAIYVASYVMDKVLYGADKGKIVFVISLKAEEIATAVNERLGRGVTMISAKGSYTKEDRTVLMCTVRLYEVAALYSVIDEYDKSAFIAVGEAGEIIGEGFKIHKNG